MRMTWVIVGLGNPDDEYDATRHNAGRMAVAAFAKKHALSEWKTDAKAKATIARGMCERSLVLAVLPDTYMNKSGSAVAKYVKSVKAAERLVVLQDDLDLPLGVIKLSFDRGSGGHKGIESIMRAIKTKKFTRIRIGVSPSTASGKLKKPQGEDEVVKFVLAKFKPHEKEELTRVFKRTTAALETMVNLGTIAAMNEFNRG